MCRKRKRVVLGVCLGWMLMLISAESRLPQLFVYNATASVPVGWYLLLSPQNVARNDMVVFAMPDDMQELAVERGWLPVASIWWKNNVSCQLATIRIPLMAVIMVQCRWSV